MNKRLQDPIISVSFNMFRYFKVLRTSGSDRENQYETMVRQKTRAPKLRITSPYKLPDYQKLVR